MEHGMTDLTRKASERKGSEYIEKILVPVEVAAHGSGWLRLFSLGFNLFLEPHDTNCGGLSGLAQVCVEWFGVGTVGLWTAVMNIPCLF